MICELCDRDEDRFEKHHLVPKSKGGLKGDFIMVCEQCADQIHALYDNKTLSKKFNTLQKLKEDPKISSYIEWVKKRKGKFKTRQSR